MTKRRKELPIFTARELRDFRREEAMMARGAYRGFFFFTLLLGVPIALALDALFGK